MFQVAVIMIYVTMGKITGGTAPILVSPPAHGDDSGTHEAANAAQEVLYAHPLPSVLMLTAIVVGVATTALGLAMVVRIREAYGTVEEDEIQAMDRKL